MNLIHGDCLEALQKIKSKSVDMVFADLPYGQIECAWDVVIPFEPLWEQLKRVGKPNTLYVFTATRQFMLNLVLSNEDWFRGLQVWDKKKGNNFATSKYRPLMSHEMVLLFSKEKLKSEILPIIRVIGHAQKGLVHPTQKPLHLLDYIVKTYSKVGDTILDPVMGSGTTGVAALSCGRNFIGIEKEKKYFDIAVSRMKSVPKRKLF